MFDVGFSEMIVIAVVALIVIGPEKLPKVARTVGALMGRMQRYVNDVKADINREIELDELKKMHTSVKDAAQEIETSFKGAVSSFEAQGAEMNAAIGGSDAQIAAETEAAAAAGVAKSSEIMSDADLAAAIAAAQEQAVPAVAEPAANLVPEPVSAVAEPAAVGASAQPKAAV
jgi:sec-independent protein translocase protein TatB